MSSDKLFTVVGVSILKGEMKMRFANSIKRQTVLEKGGHTDVRLVELSEPLSKSAAASVALQLDIFQDAEAQAVISSFLELNGGDAVVVQPEAAVHIEEAYVQPETQEAELEDLPF